MIPPRERRDEPTTEERLAEWEARQLASLVLNAAAGLEQTKKIGSLSIVWDVIVVLLAVMRREAENRGEPWEGVEHRLNEDSEDMLRKILGDGSMRERE
jgi:hypothetical protein